MTDPGKGKHPTAVQQSLVGGGTLFFRKPTHAQSPGVAYALGLPKAPPGPGRTPSYRPALTYFTAQQRCPGWRLRSTMRRATRRLPSAMGFCQSIFTSACGGPGGQPHPPNGSAGPLPAQSNLKGTPPRRPPQKSVRAHPPPQL